MSLTRGIAVIHVDIVKYVFAMFTIGVLAFMWGYSVYMGVNGVILSFCTTTIGIIVASILGLKVGFKKGYNEGSTKTTKTEEW